MLRRQPAWQLGAARSCMPPPAGLCLPWGMISPFRSAMLSASAEPEVAHLGLVVRMKSCNEGAACQSPAGTVRHADLSCMPKPVLPALCLGRSGWHFEPVHPPFPLSPVSDELAARRRRKCWARRQTRRPRRRRRACGGCWCWCSCASCTATSSAGSACWSCRTPCTAKQVGSSKGRPRKHFVAYKSGFATRPGGSACWSCRAPTASRWAGAPLC